MRPLIPAGTLLAAVGAGICKVTALRVHPDDIGAIDIARAHAALGAPVMTSPFVERGMVFVDSQGGSFR